MRDRGAAFVSAVAVKHDLSEHVSVEGDVLTVYGVKIHADLLRSLAVPTPDRVWLRIIQVENGVAQIQQVQGTTPDATHPLTAAALLAHLSYLVAHGHGEKPIATTRHDEGYRQVIPVRTVALRTIDRFDFSTFPIASVVVMIK
jgi:hypothetical protein